MNKAKRGGPQKPSSEKEGGRLSSGKGTRDNGGDYKKKKHPYYGREGKGKGKGEENRSFVVHERLIDVLLRGGATWREKIRRENPDEKRCVRKKKEELFSR